MARPPASIIAAFSGIACIAGGCGLTGPEAKFEREIEMTLGLSPGVGLDADAANGAITITEDAARDDVRVVARIRATTRERADAVRILTDQTGGWLRISSDWPGIRRPNEGVSFQIEAPGGRPVRAHSSDGAVVVTGFAGGVVADSTNGAVTIAGHDGPVEADSLNGAVFVLGATDRVDARTWNGSVRVELDEAGIGPVDIDTGNGTVVLVVGPGFAGRIIAGTANGSVTASGDAVRSVTGSESNKTIQIGEGDAESRIETGNGSIRIRTCG